MNLERLSALDRLVQQEVETGSLFGSAVTVGTADGPAYTASAGDIGPDSMCMLCSMTKPVTSVAAWILIERGIIDPFDSVGTYLPGLPRCCCGAVSWTASGSSPRRRWPSSPRIT